MHDLRRWKKVGRKESLNFSRKGELSWAERIHGDSDKKELVHRCSYLAKGCTSENKIRDRAIAKNWID